MQDAQTRVTCRRVVYAVIAAGTVATMSFALARPAAAHDDERVRACSNRTLRGDYGFVFSGTLLGQPTAGTGLRTYDGRGHFSQIDNEHSLFGTVTERAAEGTYQVKANCTGTMTLTLPDAAIVSSFVIVGDGYEVKEAVMSPPPALVTAVQTRLH